MPDSASNAPNHPVGSTTNIATGARRHGGGVADHYVEAMMVDDDGIPATIPVDRDRKGLAVADPLDLVSLTRPILEAPNDLVLDSIDSADAADCLMSEAVLIDVHPRFQAAIFEVTIGYEIIFPMVSLISMDGPDGSVPWGEWLLIDSDRLGTHVKEARLAGEVFRALERDGINLPPATVRWPEASLRAAVLARLELTAHQRAWVRHEAARRLRKLS